MYNKNLLKTMKAVRTYDLHEGVFRMDVVLIPDEDSLDDLRMLSITIFVDPDVVGDHPFSMSVPKDVPLDIRIREMNKALDILCRMFNINLREK